MGDFFKGWKTRVTVVVVAAAVMAAIGGGVFIYATPPTPVEKIARIVEDLRAAASQDDAAFTEMNESAVEDALSQENLKALMKAKSLVALFDGGLFKEIEETDYLMGGPPIDEDKDKMDEQWRNAIVINLRGVAAAINPKTKAGKRVNAAIQILNRDMDDTPTAEDEMAAEEILKKTMETNVDRISTEISPDSILAAKVAEALQALKD